MFYSILRVTLKCELLFVLFENFIKINTELKNSNKRRSSMKHLLIVISLLTLIVSCSSKNKKKSATLPGTKAQQKAPKKMLSPKSPNKLTTHWSYEGLFGPELWGNLSPEYAACKNGKSQSPINLIWRKPNEKRTLQFKYMDEPLTTSDTGHSVKVHFASQQLASISSSIYSLQQLHFHSPSEHTISGKHYPAEIHFVHKNSSGAIAVIAVMISQGNSNPHLDTILKSIPSQKNKINSTKLKLNPGQLLPPIMTHYSYKGSLTTPPCTEGVLWSILNTPITASAQQIKKLKSFYKTNNRPVQRLHGRTSTNY